MKRKNAYLFSALFAALLLMIAGCNSGTDQGTVISLDDISGDVVAPTNTQAYDSDPDTVSVGDTIEVKYVGRTQDGEVFDTNIEDVAVEAGLDNIHTDPLSFKVGAGQMIEGFDAGVVGMTLGEKKTITIPPEEAYGEYDDTLVQSYPRTTVINRTDSVEKVIEVPQDAFVQAFGTDPVEGQTYSDERLPFDYTVTGISDGNVELTIDAQVGDTILFPGAEWESEVVSEDDDMLYVQHNPENGQEIESIFGTANIEVTDDELIITENANAGDVIPTMYGNVVVKEVNDDEIILDMNHELAGKTLVFDVEVTDIQKKETVTRPEVELFVMSHCPYGTQIEKGMIPVIETLGDKADIKIKFVNYAMHGETEVKEELNQYCIQQLWPDQYIDYLSCFLQDGDSQGCVDEMGFDQQELSSCIDETDNLFQVSELFNDKSTWRGGQFPQFNIYNDENVAYGVQGSPTLVINGEVTSSARDPASLLSAVCSTYSEAPAECSTQLSTQSPAPGFGFDATASSSTSATCG